MAIDVITEERLFFVALALLYFDPPIALPDLESFIFLSIKKGYIVLYLLLLGWVTFGVDWHPRDASFRSYRKDHHGVFLGLMLLPTVLLINLLPTVFSSQPLSGNGLYAGFLFASSWILSFFESLNASKFSILRNNELQSLAFAFASNFVLEKWLQVSLIVPYSTVLSRFGFLHVIVLVFPLIIYFAFKLAFGYFMLLLGGFGLSASFTYGEQVVVLTALSLISFTALYVFNYEPQLMSSGIAIFLGLTATIVLSGVIMTLSYSYLKTLSDYTATVFYVAVLMVCALFGFVVLPELCEFEPLLHRILNQLAEGAALSLTIYWSIVLAVSFSYLGYLKSQSMVSTSRTTMRKFFHLMAILMFLSGFHFDAAWMKLSFECVLALFVLIETYRFVQKLRSNAISRFINDFIDHVVDENDTGPLVLTHIYLLLGCAVPILFFEKRSFLFLASGTLILGVGDSAASIVGSRLGKLRWSSHSKKTVEGTLGAYISMRVFVVLLTWLGVVTSDEIRWRTEAGLVLVAIFEGVLTQIDNLFLPIVFVLLLL